MAESNPNLRSHHRAYLVRCDSCGRSQKCSPGEVLAGIRAEGVACCGSPMELYVQTTWPAPSGAVGAPAARRPVTG
jgi:hypothetical protein